MSSSFHAADLELLTLELLMRQEHLGHDLWHPHRPTRPRGLGLADLQAALDPADALADVKGAILDVDVLPSERQQFARRSPTISAVM
jgi:hypothetical protein